MKYAQQAASEFSAAWISAWNAHDIEAVFKHYTEDFEIITPMAEKIFRFGKQIDSVKENVRIYREKACNSFRNCTSGFYKYLLEKNLWPITIKIPLPTQERFRIYFLIKKDTFTKLS